MRAVYADYENGPITLTAVPVVCFDDGEPYVLAASRLEAVPVREQTTHGVFVGLIHGNEDPEILRPQAESLLAVVEAEVVARWSRH
jgi:hypothetical protein